MSTTYRSLAAVPARLQPQIIAQLHRQGIDPHTVTEVRIEADGRFEVDHTPAFARTRQDHPRAFLTNPHWLDHVDLSFDPPA